MIAAWHDPKQQPEALHASSGWRQMGFMLLFLALPFTLSLPPVVMAEEIEQKPLEDRLTVRGGWAYVWGANSTITVPGPGGIAGTSLDYSKTLGGDSTTDAFRVDALWRFNEKHAAQFAWYRVAFSGQNQLQEQIVVDGTTIGVGAPLSEGTDRHTDAKVQTPLRCELY